MQTLVAWYDAAAPTGAYVNLLGVADPHVTVFGTDILVPALNKVVWAAAFLDITGPAEARMRSPRLIERGYEEYLAAWNDWAALVAVKRLHDLSKNPIELDPTEALQAQVLTAAVAPVEHYMIVALADGPLAPVGGNIRTIRGVGAANLGAAPNVWVNTALVFPVALKAGRYQVVGCKVIGPNLVAARLVFPGMAWRPGVLGSADAILGDPDLFRMGAGGVLGEFQHSSPPTMDCIGDVDVAQEVFLDLIYLG